MDTAQTIFEEMVRGGATGRNVTGCDVSHLTGSDVRHVTGSHVSGVGPDRNYVLRVPGSAFRRFFSYYSSSTVVQVPWLPEVAEGHVIPSGFPLVCACATGS